MLRIPLPLPPLAEQRRIVEKLDAVLSRVESCRARLDNIPKLLKRFRQSVLAAATSGELTREWRGGGEAEWEETTVGEVCDVSGGKRLPKGHSLVSEDTGFPYVRVTDFAAFTVDSTGVQYVPTIAVRSIARYFITSDDVFISIAGTIGIVGRVPPELSGANLTENAARIIVGPRLGPSFLMYQLASPQLQRRMHRDKIATTQDKLGLFRVKALPIEVPPLAEQAEIVRRVEQLFGYADVVESKYTLARSRLERVTPSVLGKAFRGELVEGEEG
jgi:type I restriction enzyme S subunit